MAANTDCRGHDVRLRAEQVRALWSQVASKGRGLRLSDRAARQLGLCPPKASHRRKQAADPQVVLTAALRARMGDAAVLSEVEGIIPGRKFRADIAIPAARLVIEFDGFQYHRSKAAFQKDRERQNLFVAHGWRVLRFFNKQVREDLDGVVNMIHAIAKDDMEMHRVNTTRPVREYPGIVA